MVENPDSSNSSEVRDIRLLYTTLEGIDWGVKPEFSRGSKSALKSEEESVVFDATHRTTFIFGLGAVV